MKRLTIDDANSTKDCTLTTPNLAEDTAGYRGSSFSMHRR